MKRLLLRSSLTRRRICVHLKTNKIVRLVCMASALFFYCEFLHYYVVIMQCDWPHLDSEDTGAASGREEDEKLLHIMLLADTHLLGAIQGHWFDKLRREWQMEKSFQASVTLLRPDLVFILGDLLDEGKWSSTDEFDKDVDRFRRMFRTLADTSTHVIVGNHDVGFHYTMTGKKMERFEKAFDAPSVRLMTVGGSNFVLLNSMAMEGDNCDLCTVARQQLTDLSRQLKCSEEYHKNKTIVAEVCKTMDYLPFSRPILLQHFPLYRPSDVSCQLPDAAPENDKNIPFKEAFDCVSKHSTQQILDWLKPRLVVSGHTHHGCFYVHEDGTPEWTVASFSWRNKKQPTFLMAVVSSKDFSINQCYLPSEHTVINMYVIGGAVILISVIYPWLRYLRIFRYQRTDKTL